MNDLEILAIGLLIYVFLTAVAYELPYVPSILKSRKRDEQLLTEHPTTHLPKGKRVVSALAATIGGAIGIIGGVELFVRGILGAAGWTVKWNGNYIHMNDLLSAFLLFCAGVVILFASRHNIVFEAVARKRGRRKNVKASGHGEPQVHG